MRVTNWKKLVFFYSTVVVLNIFGWWDLLVSVIFTLISLIIPYFPGFAAFCFFIAEHRWHFTDTGIRKLSCFIQNCINITLMFGCCWAMREHLGPGHSVRQSWWCGNRWGEARTVPGLDHRLFCTPGHQAEAAVVTPHGAGSRQAVILLLCIQWQVIALQLYILSSLLFCSHFPLSK